MQEIVYQRMSQELHPSTGLTEDTPSVETPSQLGESLPVHVDSNLINFSFACSNFILMIGWTKVNSEINFFKTVLEFFGIEVINMSENVDSQAGEYI